MPEYKESEKSRAERIAAAQADYSKSLQEVTSNNKLYLSTLNNMCILPYSPSECLYLAYRIPGASNLDTFEHWNEHGYRINKGQKGLTLLEENKGETVFFDISQTNAPSLETSTNTQRLPKEKLSALWSCDIRILTATKEEYTKGKTIHYDSENRAVIIDRSADIPYEQLFSELSKEIAHAYLYRNNKTSYSREAFDSIADAARYIVCRQNEIDCTLPELPNDLSPNEMKEHLENIHLISATIQSNIDYYYENGKPQFEKPITVIESVHEKESEFKEESKSLPQKTLGKKPKLKSVKELIREKREKHRKLKYEPRHIANVFKKEDLTNGKQ